MRSDYDMNSVRSNSAVFPFSRELPLFHHQFHVNLFYVEGTGELEINVVDCWEEIRKEGKGIYLLLEESCKDGCIY